MIPCKCGEPTCTAADNTEKVRQFCLTHTLRIVREADNDDRIAPVWPLDLADFIADQAGVPRTFPFVRIVESHDALLFTGTYQLRVDCGDDNVFGIECWVLPLAVTAGPEEVGNYADKHEPRFTPTTQPVETVNGIPDPDLVAAWGADDFWVRTTESIAKDVASHRQMLVSKIERLQRELADAVRESEAFDDAMNKAMN